MSPDPVALLRELRPPEPPFAPDEAALERIVASPRGPSPRRRQRRPARRLLAAAAAAALAGVAVLPGGSPDVLAQTAAALSEGDTILHYRAEVRHRSGGPELEGREPDARVDSRVEAWQTAGGRRERFLYDDRVEFVKDWDARVSMAYVAERDELIRHTDPEIFDEAAGPRALDSPTPFGGTVVGDLARLLERARRGEENVRLVGETTVRGIEVYELRLDFEVESTVLQLAPRGTDPSNAPTQTVHHSRTIYVDRERFLPVRVIERSEFPARGGDVTHAITDFVTVERLPRTPENERQLQMAPHPGAKEVVEGRV